MGKIKKKKKIWTHDSMFQINRCCELKKSAFKWDGRLAGGGKMWIKKKIQSSDYFNSLREKLYKDRC